MFIVFFFVLLFDLFLFFFFFSSRRRHTRWNCDWSSDVCSSDLSGCCDAPPSLRRPFAHHLLRRLVVAQPQEARVSQPPVARPFAEPDLGHQPDRKSVV